ncbi:MAG: NAD(P)-dependent oxidoreductase [Candidatus Heimdallarchaeota archaeon]
MKILVTGAFGNVGESTVKCLLNAEHEITCFDKRTFNTVRTARRFRKKVQTIWGDIQNKKKVERAVEGQELVMHIAAVIPPKANRNQKYTEQVNYGGTINIVDAMLKQPQKPKIIYTSSVAIYGDVRDKETPFVTEDTPFNPSPGDFYAVTKINSEKYIMESGLEYSIFRLSYIPNSKKIQLTPLMFKMPLDTPIEFTHTKDCGLALANAIDKKEIWGEIFNLGGGENCRFYYKDYLSKMLPLMGVELLPDEAFSNEPFHCCFYDTKKLEKLLQFQKHNFDDLLNEMVRNARGKRRLAIAFKPLVKPALLMLSPYYKKNKKRKKIANEL